MRMKRRRMYEKCLRWMVTQHDDGVECLATPTIYEWWNRNDRYGITMQQLTNILGKRPEIDRNDEDARVRSVTGSSYIVALWMVHPNHRQAWRAKRETARDED